MKITGKEDTIMEHSVLMSNEEFFTTYHDNKNDVDLMSQSIQETYKPYDEYLKKHKYDPESNTIEIDGKRYPAGNKTSNKYRNRINKFLRENDYDPDTETIATNIKDHDTGKNRRIKFNINIDNGKYVGPGYAKFENTPDGEKQSISMSTKTISKKPNISNFTYKHEEGHSNEFYQGLEYRRLKNEIKELEEQPQSKERDELLAEKKNKLDSILNYYSKEIDSVRDDYEDRIRTAQILGSTPINNHASDSSEGYADYYGTKHNKYGDPRRNINSTLSSLEAEQVNKIKSNTRKELEKDPSKIVDIKRKIYNKSSREINMDRYMDDIGLTDKEKEAIKAIDKVMPDIKKSGDIKRRIEKKIKNNEQKLKDPSLTPEKREALINNIETLKSTLRKLNILRDPLRKRNDESLKNVGDTNDPIKHLSNVDALMRVNDNVKESRTRSNFINDKLDNGELKTKQEMFSEDNVLMSNEEFFAEYHDDKKKVLKDLKEREENVEIKKQRDIVKKIIQKGPYGEYDNAKKKFVLNTNKILKGMSAKGYTDDDKRVVYKYLMKIVSDLEKLRDTNQFGKFNKAKHDILRMVGKETDEERVVFDIRFIDPYNSKRNKYALPRKIYGINKCAIIGFSSVENQVFKPFSKTRYFHSMDKPMTGTSLNPSHKAKDGPVYPSDRVYFIAYNCTNSEPTELDLDPGFRVSRYYEYIPKKGDVFYIDKEYHNYDSTRKMVFINTKKSLPVKDVTNEILENSSKRRVSESYTYDPEDYEDSEINENNKDEIFNEESYTERNLSIGDESFIMEMNKTMEKTLNRLDYNPKDGTIKVGLKLKNGKMLDRCRLIIGGELYERHGACFYCDNEDLDTVTPENVYVVIGRKELKQRNNTGMAIIQHELGHLKIRMVKSDAESKKLKRAAAKFLQSKPQTKDLLQYTTGEDDYDLSDDDTIDDLYEDAHDMSPEEYAADIESVKATSKHSAIKMLESFMPKIKKQIDNIKTSTDGLTRLIKSAKLNTPVKLSDFINKIEKIEESREGIGKDIIRVYGWMKDADKDIKDLKEKQKNTTNAEELERIVEDIRYKENRKSSFREELKKYKSQYKAADKPDKNDKEIIEKVRKQDNGRDIFDDYLDDCTRYFKFIKYAKMGIDLRIEYVRRYVGESYTERNGVVMNTLMKKQAHIMESYKMGIIHEKEALQLIERVMIENGDDVETSPSSGDTSALASYINSLDEASKQELLDNIESGEDYEDRETSENDEDDEGSADDESTETDESSEEEEKREEDDEDDKVEDDSDYSDTNLEDIDI